MKKVIILILAVLQISVLYAHSETNSDKAAEKFKKNVVKIRTTFQSEDNQMDENGFGFIIGESDGNLYIATPEHVVKLDDPYAETKSIEINFYKNKWESHPATLMSLKQNLIDLALIEVKKPGDNFQWEKRFYSTSFSEGDEVWFIGKNGQWAIPETKGLISELPSSFSAEIKAEMDRVCLGISGAPLISRKGIIGMITQDSNADITALSIEAIRDIVTKKWRAPWGLIDENSGRYGKPLQLGLWYQTNFKKIQVLPKFKIMTSFIIAKPADIFSFYAKASKEFLADRLLNGETLGSSGTDSKDYHLHYNWAKHQSKSRLKKALIDKFNKMALIQNSHGHEAKAKWYADICTEWAKYKVNFGSPAANSLDYNLHKNWARGTNVSVLQNLIKMRIDKIFNSY